MPDGKFTVFVTGIEQYARPGTGTAGNSDPGKQLPNVRVNLAPEPLPSSATTDTGLVGRLVYWPGSTMTMPPVTLPPDTAAVNLVAGPEPPWTLKDLVPFV